MPLIPYPPAGTAVTLAGWLWTNRAALGPAFRSLAGAVESALASDRPQLHRIGGAIVSVRDDQARVLGLLHQHTAKLDAIDAAVGGLTAGQAALGHSLATLRHLAMVGLGVHAVAHAVLLYQFRALGRHLSALAKEVRRVGALVEAQQLGELEAGLTQLEHGMEDVAAGRRDRGEATINTNAANNLARSVNTHAVLLGRELDAPRPDRPVVRELFRHLAVGLMGEAGCHLALGNAPRAHDVVQARVGLAERYARAVFAQTVGAEPVRFLCPGMARHGVTVEFLAELFRQAGHAGAMEGKQGVAAVDLVEEWRGRLHAARDPWRSSTLDAMRGELADALSAVEEVNRVKGFALAARGVGPDPVPFTDVMSLVRDEVRRANPEDGAELAFFPACG